MLYAIITILTLIAEKYTWPPPLLITLPIVKPTIKSKSMIVHYNHYFLTIHCKPNNIVTPAEE